MTEAVDKQSAQLTPVSWALCLPVVRARRYRVAPASSVTDVASFCTLAASLEPLA